MDPHMGRVSFRELLAGMRLAPVDRMSRLAALMITIVGLAGSAAAEGRLSAGVDLGVTQSKDAGAAVGPSNTLGLHGRLKLLGQFAIAIAAQRYGMSASISASAAIYLVVGVLLLVGTAKFMRPSHS